MLNFDKDSQERIFQVAEDRRQGKIVAGADQPVARILNMHPEFDALWSNGELAAMPQEVNGQIVNPFVHTALHTIIDKQIATGDPECVAATFQRLRAAGADEHDSLHAIIAVFADLHFASVRRGERFDDLDYQSRLESITVSQ